MKKAFFLLLVAIFLLGGCSHEAGDSSSPADLPDNEPPAEADQNVFPGSYTVPDGWVLAEDFSTGEKFFYIEEGHENDELPDNISINVGANRYSADDHTAFRDAIVQQLLRQLKGIDAELTGDGSYTEQGDVVYTFTITESDVVTRQYYIVGDYRYCLIHLTSFTGSESAYDAAQAMADSFIWNNDTVE